MIVELTTADAALLLQLAHFYERSMGPFRHLVRLTARGDVRARFQFIRHESLWLERFAENAQRESQESAEGSVPIQFTPRAVIAYWGRTLASLNTPRSRRKLKPEGIVQREDLAGKLEEAARRLPAREREREMATRRPVEVAWMRDRLER